jgi:hypothetical protein
MLLYGSNGHSEVVKLELILMNIETYLARFTTVRDAWTEEFYQDPSLNIAGMVEEFIAKEKQNLEAAAARAQRLAGHDHALHRTFHRKKQIDGD